MNGEQPPKKKRTWLWIVLGIFLFFFTVTAGGCVAAIMVFRQNVSISEMSASAATDEFDKIRARFAGQQPLIQVLDDRPEYVGEKARPATSTASLRTMHIVAWDDNDEHLVRLSVPFWILRLKSGPIRLSSYAEGWNDRGMSFRIDELEKHGPGLWVDVNEKGRDKAIIWVE